MIKRILVTGGCGFIGSHLCEFLLHKGHTITVIDNLSTSSINNLSFAKKRIEVIKCSVEHFDLNQLGSVDGVFHPLRRRVFQYPLAILKRVLQQICSLPLALSIFALRLVFLWCLRHLRRYMAIFIWAMRQAMLI